MSDAPREVIWLNGTHGVGKTTTAALLAERVPHSRVLDAEKIGAVLMDISPSLPWTGNFQDWRPWRELVVDTVRRVLDYSQGPLIMPMTVLRSSYWNEIREGLSEQSITIRHFVLDATQATLHARIMGDVDLGPSRFRLDYVGRYAEARTWMRADPTISLVNTDGLAPEDVAHILYEGLLRTTQES